MENFVAKNILMIVGDFSEDYEVMVPYQALLMIGHNIHTVCPNKKSGDKINTAVHDFEGHQTYTEKLGHLFALNYNFDDVNVYNYDALIIPGGRACEYLRLDKRVLEICEFFLKNNKPLASICHGLQILICCPSFKNRIVTSYPACSPEVNLAGGIYKEVGVDEAVVDGNLVTAVAWPGHPKWLRAFLNILGTSFLSK